MKNPNPLAALMSCVSAYVSSPEDVVAVKSLIAQAYGIGASKPSQAKPAFPGTVAHLRRQASPERDRGVITVAVDGNRLALAFSSPAQQWKRQRGTDIVLARLAGNPIRVTVDGGDGVLSPTLMITAAKSLVQDRPGWTHLERTPTWTTSILGPDGLVFHLLLDTKARLQDVPPPRTISWLRIPSWAPRLIQEVP